MVPSCHLPCSTTTGVLLWCITVCLTLHAVRAQSATFTSTVGGKEFTTFSFPTFDRSLMQLPANLTFAGNSSVTQNTLQITPDSNSASGPDNFLVNQTGSVFLSSPFVLWASEPAGVRYVVSFSTVFRINLYRANATNKGEGLAFVVASGNGGGGSPYGSHGGYLGLTNDLLLGLACSHPNPGERPKAQAILQILTHSAPPSDVPPSRPAFMWPAALVKGDEEMYTSGSSATCSTVVTSSLLR